MSVKKNLFVTLKRRLNNSIKSYCKQTSLHGFHYIVDTNNHIKTTLWCLVCFVCMAFCFYLIYIQLVRFTTNVTNTSITSTGYPVWENPFPAVSICNNYIVYKNKTGKLTDVLKSGGFDITKIEKFYSQLTKLLMCNHCDASPFEEGDLEIYGSMFAVLEKNNFNVNRIMQELAGPCDSILKKCFWKSKETPCSEMFKLIKTTNGFCCSFNYYGSKDVQQMDIEEDELRYYSGGSGIPFGLKVILNLDQSKFTGNIETNDGFEVVVRDGYDYPDMTMYSNSLLVGDVLSIGLYPSVLRSHADVKNVKTSLRECWFKNEGNLDATYIYSFQSCLTECKAKAIFEHCKCIPYNYPIMNPKKLCTLLDTPCLIQNELKFNSLVLTTSLSEATLSKINKRVGEAFRCHCLPTCDEVRYENFIEKSHSEDNERANTSILNVFYNSIACTKRSRNVIVTWDMLLASIGGIFGLCLGGSVLSLIELLYHVFGFFFDSEKVDENTKGNLKNAMNNKTYNGKIMMTNNVFKTIPIESNAFIIEPKIYTPTFMAQKQLTTEERLKRNNKYNLGSFAAFPYRH